MNKENQDQIKVMVFGTFDLLHAGHEDFLNQAKTLGNFLIVVVSRDSTVKKVKGEYPKHNEKQRYENVKNLNFADKVVFGNEDDKYRVIRKYKPDIIALGYDQFVFTYKLKKLIIDENLDTEIIRLKPYQADIYKSSLIKAQFDEENTEKI